MQYRCYFLNLRSEIAGVEIIEADTDAEAVMRGDMLFREQGAGYISFEVWDRGRPLEAAAANSPEQVRHWRMKAEEIRTAIEDFSNDHARRALLNSAATYETLANSAERRLLREKDRKQDVR